MVMAARFWGYPKIPRRVRKEKSRPELEKSGFPPSVRRGAPGQRPHCRGRAASRRARVGGSGRLTSVDPVPASVLLAPHPCLQGPPVIRREVHQRAARQAFRVQRVQDLPCETSGQFGGWGRMPRGARFPPGVSAWPAGAGVPAAPFRGPSVESRCFRGPHPVSPKSYVSFKGDATWGKKR